MDFQTAATQENTLIQKAIAGDKESFEHLMNRHLKVIYNYICLRVNSRENVEDIIQESMISIWLSLKNFNFQSSFRTWVIGVVRRRIADYFRSIYKTKTVLISDFEGNLIESDETENVVSGLYVEKAVETLESTEKEIVFLTFTAQLTYSEISEIMHIPIGTIKSKMSRIKDKLRKEFTEGGG